MSSKIGAHEFLAAAGWHDSLQWLFIAGLMIAVLVLFGAVDRH